LDSLVNGDAMGSDVILQQLRLLACSVLNLNLAPEEMSGLIRLDEVAGFDSITVLSFVAAVEKEFSITLTKAELKIEVLVDLPRLAARVSALQERSC
jgi:acyl carrier protein